MTGDWVSVYSTDQLFEAELVKAMLLENEIECILVNKQDSAYHIGDIELHVPVDQAFHATRLIKNESQ